MTDEKNLQTAEDAEDAEGVEAPASEDVAESTETAEAPAAPAPKKSHAEDAEAPAASEKPPAPKPYKQKKTRKAKNKGKGKDECSDADSGAGATKKEYAKAPAPKKKMPRFMKFIMILFVINVVLTAVSLVLMSRNEITYTPVRLLDFLNVVLEVVIFWLICCHFKVARVCVIVLAIFNMTVMWAVHFLLNPNTSMVNATIDSLPNVVLLLYFATSKKVRAYLTEPFTLENNVVAQKTRETKIDRRKWPFYRNLIIYYCFFSLFGHWFEAGCSKLMEVGVIQGEVDYSNTMLWRDWFYPFPMHGLAVVLIALLLYPFWRWLIKKCKKKPMAYVISFFANMFVCVCIEFFMGLVVNSNLQLWDYTNMPFNFMGQVCLQNALGFGVAASLIAWWAYPALERLCARVPKNVMNVVFVFTVAAYMIPQTLYLIDPPDFPDDESTYEISISNDSGITMNKGNSNAGDRGWGISGNLDVQDDSKNANHDDSLSFHYEW